MPQRGRALISGAQKCSFGWAGQRRPATLVRGALCSTTSCTSVDKHPPPHPFWTTLLETPQGLDTQRSKCLKQAIIRSCWLPDVHQSRSVSRVLIFSPTSATFFRIACNTTRTLSVGDFSWTQPLKRRNPVPNELPLMCKDRALERLSRQNRWRSAEATWHRHCTLYAKSGSQNENGTIIHRFELEVSRLEGQIDLQNTSTPELGLEHYPNQADSTAGFYQTSTKLNPEPLKESAAAGTFFVDYLRSFLTICGPIMPATTTQPPAHKPSRRALAVPERRDRLVATPMRFNNPTSVMES